jgi:hypothetical protein
MVGGWSRIGKCPISISLGGNRTPDVKIIGQPLSQTIMPISWFLYFKCVIYFDFFSKHRNKCVSVGTCVLGSYEVRFWDILLVEGLEYLEINHNHTSHFSSLTCLIFVAFLSHLDISLKPTLCCSNSVDKQRIVQLWRMRIVFIFQPTMLTSAPC